MAVKAVDLSSNSSGKKKNNKEKQDKASNNTTGKATGQTTPAGGTNIPSGIPSSVLADVALSAAKEKAYDAGNTTESSSIDDGKYSDSIKSSVLTKDTVKKLDTYEGLLHANNIYTDTEIKSAIYKNMFRFGVMAPSRTLSVGREYLFFTKPDLNIIEQTDLGGSVTSTGLHPSLASIPFWVDLYNSRKDTTIKALEYAYKTSDSELKDPFNHLLQNMVTSNLEVPALSAEVIDTPTNMYGVGFSYRGSSEASDDSPEFSLEFKDTRYLDIYYYFKAYEEYQTLKHHGIIRPSKFYITNKILHDQFSIYKFIVDEDMETIVYYGKMYGVFPKSLPRDVFSNPTFDNGLSYSIDFKAAFYEDMKPDILSDFNKLSAPLYKSAKYKLGLYNDSLDRADMRLATAAYIIKDTTSKRAKLSPTGYVYKLKWKGDKQK